MALTTVDDYVATFPPDVQERLVQIRRRLQGAIPGSGETIRYGMPCVTVDGGYLVHYAAWKHHIAFYPMPVLDDPLEQEVAPYRAAKDAVHFRYRDPLPIDLIERVVVHLAERRGRGR
jgi:uncharacterized protein YdhG (YjbR/CyaY superfamily)